MTLDDLDLTDEEREALRRLQHAVEHVDRAYGELVAFHHEIGSAFDQLEAARESLRAAGHDEFAATLRDEILPAGTVGDRWTYEVVEQVRDGVVRDVADVEAEVRGELADGVGHLDERELQSAWRERADGDDWRSDSE